MSEATTYRAPSFEPGTVVVAEEAREGLGQLLLDGRHTLRADEPLDAGGHDEGPNPYELLLMALGACTSMSVRLFARRRNWPLDRVTVRLRHSRVHARDCEHCADNASRLDHIDIDLELEGSLDDEQRTQLRAIAEKCPVHRTLSAPVEMVVSLKPTKDPALDARLDEALRLTFPASDPTAVSKTS